MATYIAIPKLGMTMQDAQLTEWRVNEGDFVSKGDIVLLIETSKTQYEAEALASGYVHILVPADETVLVARVVGLIAETKEELAKLQGEPVREIYSTDVQSGEESPAAASAGTPPPAAEEKQATAAARGGAEKRVRISPVARKMAEEHMIDMTTIEGTGPEGRIIREDIEKAIETKKKAPAARPAAAAPPAGKMIDGKLAKSMLPLKGMRRSIGEHMQRSLSISAQLTYMGEMDMTEMIKLRNLCLEQEKAADMRITYTDLFVMAVARTLKSQPIINASIVGNEIVLWEDINIGVAVAITEGVEGGLIVPVIKNADKKTIWEINGELRVAIEKARSGKLMPDDVTGGTFTLTNLGAFGGIYAFSTPIINQPESAILMTAKTTDRAVVRDGQIVIRPIMTFSFTFDHRVIDGAPAEMFVAALIKVVENPGLLLF
ncbi:MAG: 2-oxo acid dehydrogenase subunit E2 [Deltaproteobacteria bacterium]|nr:2-oxo acid dehydrogenase subunit E2 [Deltaproteobacteria bacterium]